MKNVHMCYIRVTEEKNENLKKEGKMRVSFVPNFRILTQVVAEKSLTKKKVYRQTDRQTNRQT